MRLQITLVHDNDPAAWFYCSTEPRVTWFWATRVDGIPIARTIVLTHPRELLRNTDKTSLTTTTTTPPPPPTTTTTTTTTPTTTTTISGGLVCYHP